MREITKGKKYRHFKGDIITVICLAKDSETLKEQVVYEHNNQIWVRDKEMFLSRVDKEKYPNIEQTYRFEEI
ncbi:MAG: DUF1653 domain-containing protein [Bacilli bacterium]